MATIIAAAGGGNWTAGGTWIGGNAPTAADDAQLTSTSGNVTIDAGAVCRSLDCNTYTGTLTHTAGVVLTIGDGTAGAGSRALRLVAGMTYTLGDPATSSITFVSTSTTLQTVTFGSRVTGDVTFNGVGGKWQLQDGLAAPSMAMTLVTGTLDTNSQTLSVSKFSANGTLTRTVTLGNSSITCGVNNVAGFIGGSAGAITITANTATVTLTGTNASFSSATLNWNGLSVIMSGSGTAVMSTFSATLANLTRTGTAVTTDGLIFPSGSTVTITSTLTVNGNSAANRVLIGSSSVGSTATINAAVVSVTNVDFMDIAATGAAVPFTGTSIGDGLGNTGITFDAPVAQTWSGNTTGSWSNAANWTSRVPLPQDNVSVNALTSGTITMDSPRLGANIDFTGSSGGTANGIINPVTIFGNIVLVSSMTYSGVTTWQWQGRSAHTVTSAGRTFPASVTIQPVTGSYTLLDDLRVANSINLPFGTFSANNFNVLTTNTGSFTSTAAHTRVLNMGSGTWSIAGASATPWTVGSAGLTVNASTSTIVFPTATAVSRTFAGGGFTYNNLTYTVAGSTGSLTITGANTFNTINFSDASNARTLTLPASTTTIITGAFNVQGTSGKLMTVNSSTGATAATLSKVGAQVSCDYLSLQDIAATGGASFVAYASTSVSGNSGWAFANLRTIAASGGNWSATGTWVEGAVPTAADRVVATAASGALTVDTAALCREFDMSNYTNTVTLSSAQTLTVGDATGGLMKLVSGMTLTLSGGTISLVSTSSNSSNGWPITTGGKTLPDVTFNGAGGSWIFQDGFAAANVTLTAGTLSTNNQAVSWVNFNSTNTNVRTLTLGSSAITVTASSSASWNCSNTTNLTVTANTAIATFTGTTPEIRGGSKNWNGLSLVLNGAGTVQFSNSATFANITRVGTASRTDTFNVSASGLVVTGTLTITSNSAVNRVIVQSGTGSPTPGVPMTITAAAVSLTNVDFSDITAAGAAAPFTGTSLGDALGNSNITFPAPATRYGVVAGNWSDTATWSTTTGGSGGASAPLCHDTVILDANSAAGTYVVDVWRAAKDINCTGFTRTLQYVTTTPVNFFGSVTLGSGMTFNTNSSATNFMGRGTHTVTSAGIVFNNSISFAGVGGTYTLADAFITNTSFNATQGILNTNGSGVTAKTAVTFASPAVINMSTSTFTLTLSTTSWNNTATINGSSSTITFSATSAVTRTFSGGGGTYGTLNYVLAGSTGALTIAGANSFGTINFSDASNARTLTLPSSTTTTIRNAFNVQGTSGKLMTVNSSSGGTPATLSKSSGIVSCDYLSVQDSTATGGAAFYAGANSTNVSGNTGWTFTVPATIVASAGGGNWTAGATWVGGVAPTAADNTYFIATSGNVTIDAGAACRSLQVDPGYTGTLTHSSGVTLTIGDGTPGLGNTALALGSGMTYTIGSNTTSYLNFISTSATQQAITTNTKTIGSWTINGVGSSYLLTDTTTTPSASTMSLMAGTLNTNSQVCNWGALSSTGSTARTLTLGSTVMTLTIAGAAWVFNGTNVALTTNTANITLSGTAATFTSNAVTYGGTVSFTGSSAAGVGGTSGVTFANLVRTSTTLKTDTFFFNVDVTISGTLTLNGNSTLNRILVQSGTVGTTRTLTAANVSVTNADFMDVTGAGAGSWNLAAISGGSGDCGGNSGITFTTAAPQTHTASAGGTWSDVTKWASRVPLPQDNVIVNSNTTGTITADMPRLGANVDFTGFAGTADFSSTANTAFGSWTNGSGMTISGTQTLTLGSRGSKTVTSSGKQFTQAVAPNAPGGTYTLVDTFSTAGSLAIFGGTFTTADQSVTCSSLTLSGTTVTANMGSSIVNLTSTAVINIINIGAGAAINSGTAQFIIVNASANTRTVSCGINRVFSTITYTVAGSTGSLVIATGGSPITTLNFSDASNARTLTFTSGVTIPITNLNVNGTAGKLMTINSSTPGSAATISKTNGIVSCDYLSIQDSTVTGGAVFYAGANSTNVSGNTGWNFTVPAGIIAAPGGGNWTTGATWVGGVAPTAAGNAIFTSTSGNVTIDTGAVCRSLQIDPGYAGTLTHTSGVTLTIGDSTAGLGNAALVLGPNMTYTVASPALSAISFVSTSVTQQVFTSNSKTVGSWTIAGAGSSYLLTDSNTSGATATTGLSAGTLNTGSQACSWGNFSIGVTASTRTLTMGSSVITITGNNNNGFWCNFVTGITVTANTAVATLVSALAIMNVAINMNGMSLVYSNTTAAQLLNGGTFNNVTYNGTAVIGCTMLVSGGGFTVTGTLAINGNSTTNRIIVNSASAGSPRVITAAVVSVSNIDLQDITGAGAGSWNLAAITGGSGDCGGNSGITFTTAVPQTHTASAGGNWSDVTKWTSRVPLPQDNVTVDTNTTGTLSIDMPRLGADTNFTGFTGTLSFVTNTSVYGHWTTGSGMTLTGGGALNFGARIPKVITSNGKQFPNNLTFICPNATYTNTTYTLADNLSTASSIIIYAGTVSTTTFNVTCLILTISGPFAVLNPGSSVFTLTSTAAVTILNTNGNGGAIASGSTAQFVIANASANDRTIVSTNSATRYIPVITYTVAGSTGKLIISGGALIGTLNFSDVTNARTLTLPSTATTTVTNFNVNGTAGKLMTVNASTPASAAILSKPTGVVSCNYLSIQDSTATGGASWYAGTNSTSVSGNSGWIFSAPPNTQASFLGFFAE